ncbi:MAG: diaminopimelate epimerase [Arenicellales bacterium]|jgi:diaminopimelate epimerase|nr:diaminopimelate epimerase [Acidiferrobacteraceae bacterium]MDP6122640.1 diaminopimelate epimerase [Arenicellales bacterium]MBT58704.1 diaminopimelate epimerase [Acidiferrobacteraceae bacterium]MDP6289217.1 diaminopimelate epimerase [Arenicellales bacterium]MDP6434824.1 diaminopimelate epimerase [Arenicellales bacterium]|tara:strand:- start:384 stop:1223 length:840 start_codon:yes stop_codon:yes gene_type:complete
MKLAFTKMQGLGNDFVVFDGISQPLSIGPQLAKGVADRHTGIGCDQILVAEASRSPDADIFYRIFNADGSEVGQCANGVRCIARFLFDQGVIQSREIVVETKTTKMRATLEEGGMVRVDMGAPRLEPGEIPISFQRRQPRYELDLGSHQVSVLSLSLGNPHAVQFVSDVAVTAVEELGGLIESHPLFPERTNAEFVEVVDRETIRARIFERGVGETRASGSGGVASAVAAHLAGLVDNAVKVIMPGGEMLVSWEGEGFPVLMIGPAVTVFEGIVETDSL